MCDFKKLRVLVSANYSSSFFLCFFFNSTRNHCPIWLPFKEVTDWCLERQKEATGTGPSLVASGSSCVPISLVCKWAGSPWRRKKELGGSRNCCAEGRTRAVFLRLDKGPELRAGRTLEDLRCADGEIKAQKGRGTFLRSQSLQIARLGARFPHCSLYEMGIIMLTSVVCGEETRE